MRLPNLFDLNYTDYYSNISIQEKNNTDYKEQIHGSRRKLIVYDKTICSHVATSGIDLGTLTKRQFASFLGTFTKSLYKSFNSNPDLYWLDIDFKGFAKNKNYQLYEDMPIGQVFWNVDLSSAYWQMAHRLGYINDKYFLKYIHNDNYKSVKRLCISFLGRPNKMRYKVGNNRYDINCDTTILKNVYKNIRNELYSIIFNIAENTEYIEYNIDGITILPAEKKLVKDYFQSMGLFFKSTRCEKISDNQYLFNGKIKNFKKAIINHKINKYENK